jgi:hypothetical protein
MASGPTAIEWAPGAMASGPTAVERGPDAIASGLTVVGRGPGAMASGPTAVERGPDAIATGSTAVERGPDAIASGSTVVGRGPDALASGPTAVERGPDAIASGLTVVGRGPGAMASGSTGYGDVGDFRDGARALGFDDALDVKKHTRVVIVCDDGCETDPMSVETVLEIVGEGSHRAKPRENLVRRPLAQRAQSPQAIGRISTAVPLDGLLPRDEFGHKEDRERAKYLVRRRRLRLGHQREHLAQGSGLRDQIQHACIQGRPRRRSHSRACQR